MFLLFFSDSSKNTGYENKPTKKSKKTLRSPPPQIRKEPPESPSKETDVSVFDAQQDEVRNIRHEPLMQGSNLRKLREVGKPVISNTTDSDESDSSNADDFEMNMNDQHIILLDHHDTDDETELDIANEQNNSAHAIAAKCSIDNKGQTKINETQKEKLQTASVIAINATHSEADDDHDLLDAPPFARDGSITTVGVVSDGSLAFNSVSVNPSVSSLTNSDNASQGDDGRDRSKKKLNQV